MKENLDKEAKLIQGFTIFYAFSLIGMSILLVKENIDKIFLNLIVLSMLPTLLLVKLQRKIIKDLKSSKDKKELTEPEDREGL